MKHQREGEAMEWFWNYHCQNQGGMCYRHKLTWAESKMGLKQKIKKACKSAPARAFGPHGPCIFRFGSRLEIESDRDKIGLDCFSSLRTINMYPMLFIKKRTSSRLANNNSRRIATPNSRVSSK